MSEKSSPIPEVLGALQVAPQVPHARLVVGGLDGAGVASLRVVRPSGAAARQPERV